MGVADGTYKINQHKRRSRTYMQCYAKWDRRIAATVGVVLFLAIIVTLIYEVSYTTAPESTPSDIRNIRYKRRTETNKCNAEGGSTVTCRNVLATDNIEEEIKKALPSLPHSDIAININDSELPDNKIPERWLNNLTIKVRSLEIVSSPRILRIDDGAFSSDYLKELSMLKIRDTGVTQFNKDIFKDMTSLGTLVLEYFSITPVTIENAFLTHVKGLDMLQLTKCVLNSDAIKNITGSVHLPSLLSIDLGYSKIESLEAGVFRSASNLQALYLRGTGLEYLHVNTFNGLPSLSRINLEGNSLETLPEGIFDCVTAQKDISLNNNPWQCNCELEWLQNLYMTGSCINNPAPVCFNHDGASLEDVDFCPSTSEDSTTMTATTSVSSSVNSITTNIPKYRTNICQDSTRTNEISFAKELVQTQTITILEEIFEFKFYVANDMPMKVEVHINATANLNYFHLLWFNSYNPNDEGCVSHLSTKIILDEMQQNNTYTVCILYNTQTTVSPYDCVGLKLPVEHSERAWIRNKTRSITIALSICLILATIIVSACLMYWCVRYHPRLIKGNNRVIIIGKQKSRPESVLTEHDNQVYVAPSVDSYATGNGSYINTSNEHSRIKERNKSLPLHRIHEETIYSNDMVYGNTTSLQQELRNWRQSVLIPRSTAQISSEGCSLYEQIPPPLPPPNEQQKKIVIAADEKSYTTV